MTLYLNTWVEYQVSHLMAYFTGDRLSDGGCLPRQKSFSWFFLKQFANLLRNKSILLFWCAQTS